MITYYNFHSVNLYVAQVIDEDYKYRWYLWHDYYKAWRACPDQEWMDKCCDDVLYETNRLEMAMQEIPALNKKETLYGE